MSLFSFSKADKVFGVTRHQWRNMLPGLNMPFAPEGVRVVAGLTWIPDGTTTLDGRIIQEAIDNRKEPEEAEDATKGRDVFNENPPHDELMAVSDIAQPVTTSLPENVISYLFARMVRVSVLNDALKSTYNAKKRGNQT